MSVINDCVKTCLEKFRNNSNSSENINEQIKIFYEDQMNSLKAFLKAYIFYPNRFLYVLPKRPGNEHLLATHVYC